MRAVQALCCLTMLIGLAACSPTGTGLAMGYDDSLSCPSGGCATLTADQNQLSITGSGKTSMVQTASGSDTVEIGGNCYVSTYPANRIEVTMYKNSTQLVTIGTSNVVGIKSSTTTPKCVGGRFDIAVNGALMPTGAVYRLHFAIVGIDASGLEYRNTASGTFDLNVTR